MIQFPNELIVEIIKNLDLQSVAALEHVCKRLKWIIDENQTTIWKPFLPIQYPSLIDQPWKSVLKEMKMLTTNLHHCLTTKISTNGNLETAPLFSSISYQQTTHQIINDKIYIIDQSSLDPFQVFTLNSKHGKIHIEPPYFPKWIDHSRIQNSKYIILNESKGNFDGGYTSIWSEKYDKLEMIARFKPMNSHHQGELIGKKYICHYGFWVSLDALHQEEPLDATVLRCWDVDTLEMDYQVEAKGEILSISTSEEYIACLVQSSENTSISVELRGLVDGVLVAEIFDADLRMNSGVYNITIFQYCLLIQTMQGIFIFDLVHIENERLKLLKSYVHEFDTRTGDFPLKVVYDSNSNPLLIFTDKNETLTILDLAKATKSEPLLFDRGGDWILLNDRGHAKIKKLES